MTRTHMVGVPPFPDGSEKVLEGEGGDVARQIGMSWHAYAMSYRSAAEALFDKYVNGTTDNYALFPIGFLWRQYVELTLKLMNVCILSAGERRKFPAGHNLQALWAPVDRFLVAHHPHASHRDAGVIIEKLVLADPTGDGFRYPVGLGAGRATLSTIPAQVDLPEFDRSMRRLAEYLDATLSMIEDTYEDVYDDADAGWLAEP